MTTEKTTEDDSPAPGADAPDEKPRLHRILDPDILYVLRSFAFAGLVCMVLSHNMFAEDRLWPLTPVWDGMLVLGPGAVSILYLVSLAAMAMMVMTESLDRMRKAVGVFFAAWIPLLLQDVNRLDLFYYTGALIVGCAMVVVLDDDRTEAKTERVKNAVRLLLSLVFIWAGLWKMNPAFISSSAPVFFEPLVSLAAGVLGGGIADTAFTAFYYAVPVIHVAIGALLLIPATRRAALYAATAMLFVILYCIGPFGISSTISPILVWSIMLVTLLWTFFGKGDASAADILAPKSPVHVAVVLVAGILPALSAFGLWPTDYSWRVWAGTLHKARIVVSNAEEAEKLPGLVQASMLEPGVVYPAVWSGHELVQTPRTRPDVYRAAAESLCEYVSGPKVLRLEIHPPPYFWWAGDGETEVSYPCAAEGVETAADKLPAAPIAGDPGPEAEEDDDGDTPE